MTASPDSTPPETAPTTTTSSSPIAALAASLPGFKTTAPPRPPAPDPLDPETTTVRPPADLSDDGAPDAPDSETNSPSAASSSPVSTADPNLFAEVARTFVGIASLGVGWIRARRRNDERLAPAWHADEDDVQRIGDPLARIAARRVPIATGPGSADLGDGIDALMGTVSYGLKHFELEAQVRAADQAAPDAGADEPE